MELRLVLGHFAYSFDAELVPWADPGYWYTVVIHPGPVNALITSAMSEYGANSAGSVCPNVGGAP